MIKLKEFIPGTLMDIGKRPGDTWQLIISRNWAAVSPAGFRMSYSDDVEGKKNADMWAKTGKDLEGNTEKDTAEHIPTYSELLKLAVENKSPLRERKVLSVFDFDDTIALTDSWIYVLKNGKEIKKLDPAQFAVYKPRPGETFDFRDFDKKLRNPRLIKQNAELLIKQLDKARRSARGTRKVTILTARRLGAPITSFFRSIGIDVYVVPLGSANPKDKADWIEKQIRKGYDTVYFMDDSPKNIRAVDNMLTRYPRVKSLTKLIR